MNKIDTNKNKAGLKIDNQPISQMTRCLYITAIIVAVALIVALVIGLVLYFVLFNKNTASKNNSSSVNTKWVYNYNETSYENNTCGLPKIKPNLLNTRIINGYEAVPHSWPWMISLGYIGPQSTQKHVCGGSLISSTFVLTAAHCVEQGTIYSMVGIPSSGGLAGMARIYVGISNVKTDKVTSNTFLVKRIISHPSYDGNSNNLVNDLALIELYTPVNTSDYVSLVCLNQMIDLVPTEPVYATGWGQIDSSLGVYPSNLMQNQFTVLSSTSCQKWSIESDKQICAGIQGTSSTAKDTCGGDSGGPIMVQTNAGRWFIVGLVSYGDSPCLGLGVYTNVKYFYSWITSYVTL